MLADASGLVAVLDRQEPDHEACLAAIEDSEKALLTTWPAFTEAVYLLHRRAGWLGVEALWKLGARGRLIIAEQLAGPQHRMRELMATFKDVPMALADASLVALAEDKRETSILSLDSHFYIYVANWGRRRHPFQVTPGSAPRGA
jgi:uncharacterized protein